MNLFTSNYYRLLAARERGPEDCLPLPVMTSSHFIFIFGDCFSFFTCLTACLLFSFPLLNLSSDLPWIPFSSLAMRLSLRVSHLLMTLLRYW